MCRSAVLRRLVSLRLVSRRLAVLVAASFLVVGCSEGQPVDAGGERGGGGLAFVLMVVFVALFAGSLFYMDHVRKRRSRDR
jgi:hypothetical protein